MIVFKSNGLSSKEEAQIFGLIDEVTDPYQDAYLTKENLRLLIKENIPTFFKSLKQGNKIAFNELGLATVTGYDDKAPRKYMKVLVKNLEAVPGLVKAIYWHIKEDLFCKVKNNNPLKDILLRNGFRFVGGRGKETLLVHKYIARPAPQYTFSKDRDEDE